MYIYRLDRLSKSLSQSYKNLNSIRLLNNLIHLHPYATQASPLIPPFLFQH